MDPTSKVVLRVPKRLGDFDVRPRMLLICGMALLIGAVAAVEADALLKLLIHV